jgi:hypothetical protein
MFCPSWAATLWRDEREAATPDCLGCCRRDQPVQFLFCGAQTAVASLFTHRQAFRHYKLDICKSDEA